MIFFEIFSISNFNKYLPIIVRIVSQHIYTSLLYIKPSVGEMDAALEVPAGGDSFAEFPTYEDFLNSQVLYISVHFKIK